jgi:hypothetical protein
MYRDKTNAYAVLESLPFDAFIMKKFIAIAALLLFTFCQSGKEKNLSPGAELVQQSIAYHDPEKNWQDFKARLYLVNTDTSGNETPFEIEIDNNTGYFSHISHQDGKEIVKDYQVLQVNYEPSVGNDHWTFFFSPETAAMEAYSFHWGEPEGGEYVVLDEETEVNGIKIPKVRKWYFTKGDQYLGTDTLIKGEELNDYRK